MSFGFSRVGEMMKLLDGNLETKDGSFLQSLLAKDSGSPKYSGNIGGELDGIGLLEEPAPGRAHRSTIFDATYETEMEEKKPSVLGFLNTARGLLVQILLVAVTILLNVYEGLLKRRTQAKVDGEPVFEPFHDSSPSFFQSGFSIVVGIVAALCLGQFKQFAPDASQGVFKQLVRTTLKFAPVGILFAISQICVMKSHQYITSDLYKVSEQLRILVSALFMVLLSLKKFSILQWLLMVTITLQCGAYMRVNVKGDRAATDADASDCRFWARNF
jgi:hypothetical protein